MDNRRKADGVFTREPNRRLARDDLLQIAVSLVKSAGPDSSPAGFVSDVALTFEALREESHGQFPESDQNHGRRWLEAS